MKKITVLISFLFISFFAIGQGYFTAAGVRVGDGYGMTLQQRLAKKVSFEGIIKNTKNRNEVMLAALVERHVGIITRKLNFYVGAGVHQGFINNNVDKTYKNPFGVTGMAGLEATFGRFNISYDFKPALNLTGGTKKLYTDTALSLRYVIVKDKVFKKIAKNKRKKKRKKKRENFIDGIFNKNN